MSKLSKKLVAELPQMKMALANTKKEIGNLDPHDRLHSAMLPTFEGLVIVSEGTLQLAQEVELLEATLSSARTEADALKWFIERGITKSELCNACLNLNIDQQFENNVVRLTPRIVEAYRKETGRGE